MNELNDWYSHLEIITDPKLLGHLKLAAVSVEFLLFRPFMKAGHSGPKTLKFSMVAEDFERLISRARFAIYWAESHSQTLEGQIIGQYSYFVCCLVQYHSYVGQGTPEALKALQKGKEVLNSIQNPDCLVRRRVHDVVHVLWSAAGIAREQVVRRRHARAQKISQGDHHSIDSFESNIARPVKGVHPLDDTEIEERQAFNLHDGPHAQLTTTGVEPTNNSSWWWDVGGIFDINQPFVEASSPSIGSDGIIPGGFLDWNSLYNFLGSNERLVEAVGVTSSSTSLDGSLRSKFPPTISNLPLDYENLTSFKLSLSPTEAERSKIHDQSISSTPAESSSGQYHHSQPSAPARVVETIDRVNGHSNDSLYNPLASTNTSDGLPCPTQSNQYHQTRSDLSDSQLHSCFLVPPPPQTSSYCDSVLNELVSDSSPTTCATGTTTAITTTAPITNTFSLAKFDQFYSTPAPVHSYLSNHHPHQYLDQQHTQTTVDGTHQTFSSFPTTVLPNRNESLNSFLNLFPQPSLTASNKHLDI